MTEQINKTGNSYIDSGIGSGNKQSRLQQFYHYALHKGDTEYKQQWTVLNDEFIKDYGSESTRQVLVNLRTIINASTAEALADLPDNIAIAWHVYTTLKGSNDPVTKLVCDDIPKTTMSSRFKKAREYFIDNIDHINTTLDINRSVIGITQDEEIMSSGDTDAINKHTKNIARNTTSMCNAILRKVWDVSFIGRGGVWKFIEPKKYVWRDNTYMLPTMYIVPESVTGGDDDDDGVTNNDKKDNLSQAALDESIVVTRNVRRRYFLRK